MKKQEFAGIIVYLLMMAVVLIYGLTVLRTHSMNTSMSPGLYFLYVFGSIVVGIIISAILFEVGHIIGAKIGGYKIIAVNILFLCLYKKDSKWKFGFKKFEGLTGETIILPKEDKVKDSNPSASYSISSLLLGLYIIAGVILFIVFNQLGVNNNAYYDVGYFILTTAIVGAVLLIYNIVPFELDTINDGYRLSLVRNPKNRNAFNRLLLTKYSDQHSDSEIELFSEITDFTAELNLKKAKKFLGEQKYQEAYDIIANIAKNRDNISQKNYYEAKCEQFYVASLFYSMEDLNALYDSDYSMNDRRDISELATIQGIRAYVLMAGLFDKSKNECLLSLNKLEKAFKKIKKDERKEEIVKLNEVIDKVDAIHPNWQLSDYKINLD